MTGKLVGASGRTAEVAAPRPVIGPVLRRLLPSVFALFGLLCVNGFYLGTISVAESVSGQIRQDYLYQLMFLAHLILGFALILPFLGFALGHLRNAVSRPNRRAVTAGLALFGFALLVLASGIALTRLGDFDLRDPGLRRLAYWVHVITPFVVAWLFVLHRLAGRKLRWIVGVRWGTLALLLSAGLVMGQWGLRSAEPSAAQAIDLSPALARTESGGWIPAETMMVDGYCRDCHQDVHETWRHSAHRMSSFNNPAYRFSVLETREVLERRDGTPRGSRFCAVCHDPVPLFSGRFDDPEFDHENDPTAQAGITCTACHAITQVNGPRGNGDYTIAEPVPYPFAYSSSPLLRWVNHQLIKANPAFHKQTYLKPVHKTAEFCSVCHKVFLPEELNGYKWLRGQNHYDSFLLSGVSGHGASSFYYPPEAVPACRACHMPLQPSEDFGAQDFDGSGRPQVHSHLFVGANTALPHLLGFPEWVNAAHRRFLEGALRVDLFGIREQGDITGTLHAPLRPALVELAPGKRYLLDAVIRTLRPGHQFTEGTADSNEVWVDLALWDGDRLIGRSGAMNASGEVDPWSHFVNAYLLDKRAQRIDRRNAQDIMTALYNHQIPPGAADVAHFGFRVPDNASGPIRVEARLLYRKFDTRYLRYFNEDESARNDLPVTVLASDRLELPVAGRASAPTGAAAYPVEDWERWNDYGIGLLRKGRHGELRQAEQAFREVENLGRGDGAVNLARVYYREGRLDDAARVLGAALEAEHPGSPWVVAWLSGLINKQNGQLDQAIADFKRVATTDFADARRRGFDFGRDYRVLAELGQTLVERAKMERGSARRSEREALLREAQEWFGKVLAQDPENLAAHFNLALTHQLLGNPELAAEHRALYDRYRPDDNAGDRVIAVHRSRHPAADHAAEPVAIYDLQRPGAFGMKSRAAVVYEARPPPIGD